MSIPEECSQPGEANTGSPTASTVSWSASTLFRSSPRLTVMSPFGPWMTCSNSLRLGRLDNGASTQEHIDAAPCDAQITP